MIEFSSPAADAPCPNCGCLLWQSARILETVRKRCAESLSVLPDRIHVDARFDELGTDSIDLVHMLMELEEEFDMHIRIPDDEYDTFGTFGDLVRYIDGCGCGKPE